MGLLIRMRFTRRVIATGALAVVGLTSGVVLTIHDQTEDCDEFRLPAGRFAHAGDHERETLARRIDRCGTLIGLRRRAVARLLGPPDVDTRRGNWLYYLGPEPGPFSIDDLDLEVDFDAAGRVRNTGVGAG